MKKAVLLLMFASGITAYAGGAIAGDQYVTLGMGGGGSMFSPASSPHNSNLMFVSCDMGGFYRSEDAGGSWQMVDFRITRGSTLCRPVFHPVKKSVMYFAGKVSEDEGKTWRRLAEPQPWGRFWNIAEMGIDPETGRILCVGTKDGAFISQNEGKSWEKCDGVRGFVTGVVVDATSPGDNRRVFVGTEEAIYRSDDDGRTWSEYCSNLPWRGIRSFSGATDVDRSRLVLYCIIPSKAVEGKFQGGVFRSRDLGESWESVMQNGMNTDLGKVDRYGWGDIAQYQLVLCADGYPERVYVTNYGTGYWPPHHNTVYRSDDAGEHWRYVFNWDMRFKEKNVGFGWSPYRSAYEGGGPHHRNGVNINPKNPDLLLYTNAGEIFVTTDGGGRWQQHYSRYAPGQKSPYRNWKGRHIGRWQSIGLEVTTIWQYYIDPFDHDRHYICYTDIGFAISTDHGETWWDNTGTSGTPWRNTTYELAFDPEVRGLVWAAMSNVHDIPHSTHTWADIHTRSSGGVCVSKDGCATWEVSSKGLPEAPCTSIVLDPTSSSGKRVFYAAIYGHGVYKSTDNGKTWRKSSQGLPLDSNPHTLLVKRHPDGALFVSISASRRRESRHWERGGLFRSLDDGGSWEDITASQSFYWATGFDFDPRDSNIVYLAAGSNHENPDEGGLWKTEDGGVTWRQVLGKGDLDGKSGSEPDTREGMFVTIAPDAPDTVYLGTTAHGLWYSHDSGKTWKQLDGVPFGSIHRVTMDPDDPQRVYITTFGGGIFTGPRP